MTTSPVSPRTALLIMLGVSMTLYLGFESLRPVFWVPFGVALLAVLGWPDDDTGDDDDGT